MEVLLVTVAAVALAWRCSAFLLGAFAWVLVVLVALSLAVGEAVPAAVVALAVGAWAGSQVVSRVRRGVWRSDLLRAVLP